MSREIDLTQPLSEEDKKYLEERAEYAKLAENKRHVEGEEEFSYPGQGPGVDDTGLPANTGDMGAPKEERVDQGVTVMKDGENPEQPDDYDDPKWTNEKLRDEIRDRNSDREANDQLSTAGNKAELIATLRQDDADKADSDDDDPDDDE